MAARHYRYCTCHTTSLILLQKGQVENASLEFRILVLELAECDMFKNTPKTYEALQEIVVRLASRTACVCLRVPVFRYCTLPAQANVMHSITHINPRLPCSLGLVLHLSEYTSTTKTHSPLFSSPASSVLHHANAATAELGKLTAASAIYSVGSFPLPSERCLPAAVILREENIFRKSRRTGRIPSFQLQCSACISGENTVLFLSRDVHIVFIPEARIRRVCK